MGVYLYPNNTETPLKYAYIGIPNPTSIVLDKSSINLTTVWQTEQLTATIEPTVSDKTITWTTSDSTVATVSTTWLVTCVTPWECTITATTVNGLTATCSVVANQWVLFAETDLSTSNLWLFSAETTSWDWRYARTLASIANDWQWNYYYQTAWWRPVCLRLRNNYPTLMTIPSWYTNRKVKVIYDYLCIAWNLNWTICGRWNRDSSYSPYFWANWGTATSNVIYTAEVIMDVGANTESWTIFFKSDWSKSHDFWPNTMPTATSWSYYENDCWLGYWTDSINTPVRLGNVHIYTQDI